MSSIKNLGDALSAHLFTSFLSTNNNYGQNKNTMDTRNLILILLFPPWGVSSQVFGMENG